MWARWVVRRKLSDNQDEVDIDVVAALVEEASRALRRHSTIKSCHSKASRQIERAAGHVADLVGEVEGILEQLQTELNKS